MGKNNKTWIFILLAIILALGAGLYLGAAFIGYDLTPENPYLTYNGATEDACSPIVLEQWVYSGSIGAECTWNSFLFKSGGKCICDIKV